MSFFQSGSAFSSRNLPDFSSSDRRPGESTPPMTMTLGTSSLAFDTITLAALPMPKMRPGMNSVGTMIMEIRVLRSRRVSRSSFT